MIADWLTSTRSELWLVPVSSVLILTVAVAMVRLFGLRALSKMSSFDFLVTVALGSILASVAASSTSIVNGGLAFASLLGVQAGVALGRRRSWFGALVDNVPRVLMTGPVMDEATMTSCRITRHEVIAKLREANVTHLDQVLAVVLETTGDISVLHGTGPLDGRMLEGVAGSSRNSS